MNIMDDMLLPLVMKAAGSALTGLVHDSLSESKCRLNVQGVGIHKYGYTSLRITSMLGLLPFTLSNYLPPSNVSSERVCPMHDYSLINRSKCVLKFW